MGKNFTAVFAVCLGIAALPLACGGDDDDDGSGDGNKGGKGGSSGSATGGSSTGGKGGTNTGGSSTGGKGGTNTGGSPTGGTAGTAGTDGGMGGADGGMGGEGGSGDPPLTPCEQACAIGSQATCAGDCEDWCGIFYTTPDCVPLVDAYMICLGQESSAADWTCTGGMLQSPAPADACEDEANAVAAMCI